MNFMITAGRHRYDEAGVKFIQGSITLHRSGAGGGGCCG